MTSLLYGPYCTYIILLPELGRWLNALGSLPLHLCIPLHQMLNSPNIEFQKNLVDSYGMFRGLAIEICVSSSPYKFLPVVSHSNLVGKSFARITSPSLRHCRAARRTSPLTPVRTSPLQTISYNMDDHKLRNYLADAPPTVVRLEIKPHFDTLTDQEKRYAHYISR